MGIIVRKNDNLLNSAKLIFGDIIVSAFITTEVKEDLNYTEASFFTEVDNYIEYDGEDIILTFSNGKSVLFTNSEWASIQSINMKNTQEV